MGVFSKCGNWAEKNLMYGMTPKTLKANPALYPMYFFIFLGVAIAAGFSARTLLTNPDAVNPFTKKGNWEKYRDGTRFKFFDFSGLGKVPSQAPEYRLPGDPKEEGFGEFYFK